MNSVFGLLSILGFLSLLPFGLSVFSDGLQQLGGNWVYRLVAKPAKNKFSLIFRGLAMTSVFQSPSNTVQMVAGSLNAGLLNLQAALYMVIGANLGSLVIFLIPILFLIVLLQGSLYLGLLCGGIILLIGYILFRFGSRPLLKGLGKSMIGLGIISLCFNILLGNGYILDQVMKPLHSWNQSIFFAYFLGFMLAALFRSPIIIYATVFLYFNRVQAPLCFLMGGLLAQSVSLLMVTKNGNIFAKRVARLHLAFGLMATLVFLFLFLVILKTDYQSTLLWYVGHDFQVLTGILYLSVLIITFLIFMIGQGPALRFVERLVPEPEMRDEKHLEVLGNPEDMLPMTALVLGQRQISKLQDIVHRMFVLTREYIQADENQARKMAKIKDYERITDNVKREIIQFIQHLGQQTLTPEQSAHAQSLMKIADELESVADYLDKLAIFCTRLREEDHFEPELRPEFNKYFEQIYEFFNETSLYIDPTHSDLKINLADMGNRAFDLKKTAEEMRVRHVEKMGQAGVRPTALLIYSDMLVALRKVRSHTRNIGEAIP